MPDRLSPLAEQENYVIYYRHDGDVLIASILHGRAAMDVQHSSTTGIRTERDVPQVSGIDCLMLAAVAWFPLDQNCIDANAGASSLFFSVRLPQPDGPPCHIAKPYPVPRLETEIAMKQIFAIILAAVAAAALFGGLVYAVLLVAHVSEPAAATVYGLTLRRLWATATAAVALGGVIIGGVALARSASRFGTTSGRLGAIVALVAGLAAVVSGGLNLAMATGGPGTGNGVVGGAAALVLGLIAVTLGALAQGRLRRTALSVGQ